MKHVSIYQLIRLLLFLTVCSWFASCAAIGYNANGCRKAINPDSKQSIKHFNNVKK